MIAQEPEILDTIDEVHFYLDAPQAEVTDWFLRNKSRQMITMGARGSGKSGLIRAIILMAALGSKKQILYASQSNSNSLDQYNKLISDSVVKTFCTPTRYHQPFVKAPHPTITFDNGSTVVFWSLEDDESKRGLHPRLIIVDESQSISHHSWNSILFPMSIRPGGTCKVLIFGSCPETEEQWAWKLYEKGKIFPNDSDIKSFMFDKDRMLSFRGTKGKQLLAETRATMSAQEFQREFDLIPGGQGVNPYYKPWAIQQAIDSYNYTKVNISNGTLLCFDPSLGTVDPSAYIIGDLQGNIIEGHSFPKGTVDDDMIRELRTKCTQYRSLMVVESNATPRDTYIGLMKKLMPYSCSDIPLRQSGSDVNKSKNDLCDQLGFYIEQKPPKISINPECKVLIAELCSIHDYKSEAGKLQIRAPKGQHDDQASCAWIYCEALRRGWHPVFSNANPALQLL